MKTGVTAIRPSAATTLAWTLSRPGVGRLPETIVWAISTASSRSSTNSTSTDSPRPPTAARVASASWSASSRVLEGDESPAVMTTTDRLIGW